MAKNKIISNIIIFILLFISLALILSYSWIKDFFGDYVDYNEIIFNITAGFDSVGGAPPRIFKSFLFNVIFKSLVFSGLIILIFSTVGKRFVDDPKLILACWKTMDLQRRQNQYLVTFFLIVYGRQLKQLARNQTL